MAGPAMTAWIGAALLVFGAALSLLAAAGVVRFPSALARMHAATKSASLGLALLAAGAGIASGSWELIGASLLVTVFLFVTAPISGHLLGRAAYLAGQAGELVHDGFTDAPPDDRAMPTPAEGGFSVLRWVGMAGAWMLLWRDVSIGTAIGGLVVAGVIETWIAGRRGRTRIAPLGAIVFGLRYAGMVVASNLRVAWEVITPDNTDIREAIVAVPLQTRSMRVALLVANAVTFTPGTLTIDLSGEPPVLFVHVLHFESEERVRSTVWELERLAMRALPAGD
jgi:monovalent cation/proton antiporter MnhG/PhaG subunit